MDFAIFRRSMYMRDMTKLVLVGCALFILLVPDKLGWYTFPRVLFILIFLALCAGMIYCNGRMLYQNVVYGKEKEINDDR